MDLTIRSFLNTDVPAIVDLWRRSMRFDRAAARVQPATFEERVLAKPYFQAEGLQVAVVDGRPLGFAHAGFAPTRQRDALDFSQGVLSIVVCPMPDADHVTDALLEATLQYLRDRGAVTCHFGSQFPCGPFYLGLYGGALLPGLLDDDISTASWLQRAGFQPQSRVWLMQKSLQGFRPPIDRRQMAIRRQFDFVFDANATPKTWWDSCQLCNDLLVSSALIDQRTGEWVARAVFWDIQPLGADWGVSTMGLYDFHVIETYRRSGLGSYLICETMRELVKESVARIEVQVLESDVRGVQMAKKLGFELVARGTQWSRDLTG